MDRWRVGIVAPPMLSIPPKSYAGTERVVAALVDELCRRGHEVTLFAAGDSTVDCELVPIVPRSLWASDYRGQVAEFVNLAAAIAWREHERFDIIHSHLDMLGFVFARHCPTPVLTTLHGRLDRDGAPALFEEFTDIPLVAISESQRRWFPDANWVATIHHGLDLARMPFSDKPGEYLAFVGRVAPEKGIGDAIELCRRVGMRLRMVAKVYDRSEQAHFDEIVAPAIEEGVVEFLGELAPIDRDPVVAGARATLMLGAWPEPFGLVAIESMATGTPVIGRRAGALTETVEHGRNGFLVDDVAEAELAVRLTEGLDRAAVRKAALERFSPGRMVDQYEEVYARIVGKEPDRRRGPERQAVAGAAPIALRPGQPRNGRRR